MSDLETNVVEIIGEIEKEELNRVAESDLIALSNGTVLRAKGVPPLLAQKIEAKFKYPRVPKVFNEDKGRDEENPNDPEYLARCAEVDAEKNLALVDLLVGLGTELVELGDGVEAFEGTEWREEVEFFLGETLPTAQKALYLYWVKYYLLGDAVDIQKIARKVASKMGVPETAVGDALTEMKSN